MRMYLDIQRRIPEPNLSQARKYVHMEERSLDSQKGGRENNGKKKKEEQAPPVTRLYQAGDGILVWGRQREIISDK